MPAELELEVARESRSVRRPGRAGWAAAAVVAVLLVAVLATAGQDDASPAATQRSASIQEEPLQSPGAANESAAAATAPGEVGAGFSVVTTGGASFAVPAGRPTVLFFMTTEGCASCAEEAGALEAVARRWGDRAAILAVEMVPGTPVEYVDAFAEFMGGLRYPFAVDDGQLVRRFGARALDTTVVLDGQGREVFRDSVPTDEATLDDALNQAT